MNILKIQQDFLKGVLKERGKDHKDYHMGMSMYGVGFTDGRYMAILSPNDNYIGFYDIPEFNLDSLIPKDLNGYQAALPVESFKIGKVNLTRLEVFGSFPRIYANVDSKYLKYFDKGAIFYIKDKSSLIIVRENDNIVGVICPYIIKEVNENA